MVWYYCCEVGVHHIQGVGVGDRENSHTSRDPLSLYPGPSNAEDGLCESQPMFYILLYTPNKSTGLTQVLQAIFSNNLMALGSQKTPTGS